MNDVEFLKNKVYHLMTDELKRWRTYSEAGTPTKTTNPGF